MRLVATKKFHIFVIGTTLYICMSTLLFGEVFSLLLTEKTTMFTVLCRDMRILIDKVFLYVIGKYKIM